MAAKLFYVAQKCYKNNFKILAKIICWFLRYVCGIEIEASMKCGTGLRLPHNGLGCVIHVGSIIGDNVTIHQNVTLGGREGSGLPIICDNVDIGVGAVILGDITIGKGSKIGANAVVIHDVPANSIAVGVPAVVKPKKECI